MRRPYCMTVGVITTLGLVACAGQPVKPAYVSPTQYQSLSCDQLLSEYQRIGSYLKQGVDVPSRRAVGVGVGIGGLLGGGGGIFPSVSINMGQSSNSPRTEYAKLLGQQEAIAQAARFKGCPSMAVSAPAKM